jgi:hypothetical protein
MPDGRVKDAALETLLKTHHSDGARVIVFCLCYNPPPPLIHTDFEY